MSIVRLCSYDYQVDDSLKLIKLACPKFVQNFNST
jgi:hypothetical protein